MLLKKYPKLFLHTSRLIYDSVKRNKPIQNKPAIQNLLFDTFEINKPNSPADWKLIRQECINDNGGHFTEKNVDASILGLCISKNNYILGSSYIDFLNKENIKFTLAASGKYFKMIYLANKDNCFVAGNKIMKDQEHFILKKFYDIKQEHQVLDSFTLENSITALSLTKEWRKCVDLLEEIKVTASPNSHSYSATVSAAFLNKEENLAWQLLNEMVLSCKYIDNIVYHAYINFLKNMEKQQNLLFKLDKLLFFLQQNDIILNSDEVPLKMVEFCNKIGLPSSLTTVSSNKGICRSCNLPLEKFNLKEGEFEELKNKLFENVIIGKDIFAKTDPREVEKFKDFIREKEKFDVVLDGLNIAYSAGTKHTPQVYSALIASVVSYFAKQDKKILVVGRYHMHKWPKKNWKYITDNATVFLTQDISQDDPYLLYCALNSGKNTIIVTRDLMRSHKFLLKIPKLKSLFNRWLSQRQYQLLRVSGTGNPIFSFPPPYTVTAQKNRDVWHVPFKDLVTTDPSDISWLCIQC